jgi:NAD(P)-dependent dehydrogenase (short-subunit alcohol dehydrogenase family)
MINLNLRCAVEMFRAVLPGMRSRKRGRILAIGSRAGVDPAPHIAAYGASKAALIHVVRSLAVEVKDDSIAANIVLPSTIDTAANRAASPKADFSAWVAPAAIASLLVWLASDQAGAVSGAAIPIYGKA